MSPEPSRSRAARVAAESALVRVVHHYGARPEFVVLGGLVPELLCSQSNRQHAGTTDIDVQVDLEIASGSLNANRLEQALLNAGFQADAERVWRWRAGDGRSVVKFELLADLDDQPTGATVQFSDCEELGAANLRGTGFAARDFEVRSLRGDVDGVEHEVDVCVAGLAGFLLAKVAAAFGRRSPKDWYDIAFVLLHNDVGGPEGAAVVVNHRFGDELAALSTSLDDLRANFAHPSAQGPRAYADQLGVDHPDIDETVALADAVVAIETFLELLSR